MIKQHWAQKVVKKASSIIKAEVLITNRGGQIIATSNPDRVGEVHQAARHSIERNLPIDIELEDMSFGTRNILVLFFLSNYMEEFTVPYLSVAILMKYVLIHIY